MLPVVIAIFCCLCAFAAIVWALALVVCTPYAVISWLAGHGFLLGLLHCV